MDSSTDNDSQLELACVTSKQHTPASDNAKHRGGGEEAKTSNFHNLESNKTKEASDSSSLCGESRDTHHHDDVSLTRSLARRELLFRSDTSLPQLQSTPCRPCGVGAVVKRSLSLPGVNVIYAGSLTSMVVVDDTLSLSPIRKTMAIDTLNDCDSAQQNNVVTSHNDSERQLKIAPCTPTGDAANISVKTPAANSQASATPIVTPCACSQQHSNSDTYLSPHCVSCIALRQSSQNRSSKTHSKSPNNLSATYMTLPNKTADVTLTGDVTNNSTPPALPQRNVNAFLKSVEISQRMCKCSETRKQTKRTIHLEDEIEGMTSRVYRVKDIIDSVDDLIGAFCEDELAAVELPKSSNTHTSLFRKPSFRLGDAGASFLKRHRSGSSLKRSCDRSSSKDSGFDSDLGKEPRYATIAEAKGHCGLKDCSNCQEYQELYHQQQPQQVDANDDSDVTLDCYSYARTKRLYVEAYIPTKHKKQSRSHQASDTLLSFGSKRILQRSKSLLQQLRPDAGGAESTAGTSEPVYRSVIKLIKDKTTPVIMRKHGADAASGSKQVRDSLISSASETSQYSTDHDRSGCCSATERHNDVRAGSSSSNVTNGHYHSNRLAAKPPLYGYTTTTPGHGAAIVNNVQRQPAKETAC